MQCLRLASRSSRPFTLHLLSPWSQGMPRRSRARPSGADSDQEPGDTGQERDRILRSGQLTSPIRIHDRPGLSRLRQHLPSPSTVVIEEPATLVRRTRIRAARGDRGQAIGLGWPTGRPRDDVDQLRARHMATPSASRSSEARAGSGQPFALVGALHLRCLSGDALCAQRRPGSRTRSAEQVGDELLGFRVGIHVQVGQPAGE